MSTRQALVASRIRRVRGPLSKDLMECEVRSTDGKVHRVVFDRSRKLIEFGLLSNKPEERENMRRDMNELLCVRGTPIWLRGGVPVDLNTKASDSDSPTSLFFYFAGPTTKVLWRVREVVVLFASCDERNRWLDALSSALKGLEQRPKSLWVFVNPYGGKRKAGKIYFRKVKPILEMANIDVKLKMTERANDALDTLRTLDASEWNTVDGVVSVGGDGLFNECLSAIIMRTQEEAGIDIADANVDFLSTPRMRFGIIGAGSANSIVSSVHGTNDYPTAALHIAMGSQCSVDVCTVHRGNSLMRISANAISFGWLGDVLAESERHRWMGPFRYQYAAFKTTMRNSAYTGRVSFLLTSDAVLNGNVTSPPKCSDQCSVCAREEVSDGPYSHHLQTEFSHVICCVIPCVSPFTPHGLAPYTGLCDGSMDLAIVPRVSRCKNISFMLRVARHGGRYMVNKTKNSRLTVFRVSRWAFTPVALLAPDSDTESKTESKQGVWNLDGEIMKQPADAALHFRLHPRLIKYFGREVDINHLITKQRSVRISKIVHVEH